MMAPKTQPLAERIWPKVKRTIGCWLWTGAASRYGVIGTGGHRGVGRVHRLVYEMTKGPIPAGMQVLHSCDTPLCVRPSHLHLGTHADNMEEMRARGRHRGGLTPIPAQTVAIIKQEVARGTRRSALARRFGYSWSGIDKVAKR